MNRRPFTSVSTALPEHRRRIERQRLKALDKRFERWLRGRDEAHLSTAEAALPCAFLSEHIAEALEQIRSRQRAHAQFVRQISRNPELSAGGELHLLNYARTLGADGRRLSGDEQALARDFGADALNERVQKQISLLERDIGLAAALLGLHCAIALQGTCSDDASFALRWRQIDVEDGVAALLSYEGNNQLRLDAFGCLATAMSALPSQLHGRAVSASATQYIFRLAQEPRADIWLQCEALALLAKVSPEFFAGVARRRLGLPADGDDLFVRQRCVALIADALADRAEWTELLTPVAGDPSPFVRQALARALPKIPDAVAARAVARLLVDREPCVQAQALLALPDMLAAHGGPWFAGVLVAVLDSEQPAFTHRVALTVAERGVEAALADKLGAGSWGDALIAAADRLAARAPDLRVRQWAAECAEWLHLHLDPQDRAALAELAQIAARCRPGRSRRLPRSLSALSPERLGRLAQVLARRDFGLHFARRGGRWVMLRGHRFGLRLWRVLHEFAHPSPDKRQAFRHTVARIFRGTVHAPSGILAELSETKVPGEPLQQSAEAGWRNWLPLPDQLISLLDEPLSAGPLKIHTPFGVTTIAQPRGLAARLRARTMLTLRLARFSALRNWREGARLGPDAYLRAMRKLGFALSFEPYEGRTLNPAVQRFFAIGLPVGGADLWQRLQRYFFSAYENTLYELALFVALAVGGFVGRHAWTNLQLKKARAAIPLVIGGWGTRGKSGTERLKAALFNGLGYSVVSKTTGCEAMFLHCLPFQPLREMFLFRPYDKATIWEQHQVTRLAHRLGADVMLWECMALTPDFVRLLQKHWMRDDLATITNTFPDHEDLQGPAGINLPQVMGNFIPDGGTVITTEEQMRPILAEAARKADSELIGVGWLESGLLAPDVQKRFPYEEHPDNIALVLRMAAELDIEPDVALREMADRVVLDLGVLKVYPEAVVDGRRLSFANGMSANERFGCLGNWTRLGFDAVDVDAEPGTLVSTVVNNRADRIARSRVFAGILVNDISADRHFLIGSNLEGLLGYIREAWEARAAKLTLQPESGEAPLAVLEAEAERLRLPYTEARVKARLAAMLAGCGLDAALAEHWDDAAGFEAAAGDGDAQTAEIAAFLKADLEQLAGYRAFATEVETAGAAPAALDERLRELMWQAFERKLVVIWDYHARGNRIVQVLAGHTPPGCRNRIIGMQNIKGTGLDFVYRWQAWDRCHRACEQLASRDGAVFREGLRALADFQEFGLLTEAAVGDALAAAHDSSHGQSEHAQAELRVIASRFEQTMAEIRGGLSRVRRTSRLEQAIRAIEGFVDAGDALWRRKRANQIYDDLVSQRISSARAVTELMMLTQRQKGGWLYHSLLGRIRGLRSGIGELLSRWLLGLKLAAKFVGRLFKRKKRYPDAKPGAQRT